MDADTAAGVRALRAGRARFDLSGWVRVRVAGTDAARFLGNLVSGPVEGLGEHDAARSLLLGPTGRVRADVTVARPNGHWLLVQDPGQPRRIDDLLAPYVLSSDVVLTDAGPEGGLFALLGPTEAPDGDHYRPGALGMGFDAVTPPGDALPEVGAGAVEAWRILEGRPRFGTDFGEDALPAEAGLDGAIDWTKGCFVGQEAVARVRNFGHPPFVVIAARADQPIRAGEAVRAPAAPGEPAGIVTSATEDPEGGFAILARVRWAARDDTLRTETGVELRRTA